MSPLISGRAPPSSDPRHRDYTEGAATVRRDSFLTLASRAQCTDSSPLALPSFVARLAMENRVPVAPKHTVRSAIAVSRTAPGTSTTHGRTPLGGGYRCGTGRTEGDESLGHDQLEQPEVTALLTSNGTGMVAAGELRSGYESAGAVGVQRPGFEPCSLLLSGGIAVG
jgi:hypothetical protein